MKSRFELDQSVAAQISGAPIAYKAIHGELTARRHVDPESVEPECNQPGSYDASEMDFANSLEKSSENLPRFVVEEQHPEGDNVSDAVHDGCEKTSFAAGGRAQDTNEDSNEGAGIADLVERESLKLSGKPLSQPELGTGIPWRQEVSARLTRYQARRRVREPRYPSLQLKFDTQETWRDSSPEIQLHSSSIPNMSALAQSAPATNAAPENIPFPVLPPRHLEHASRVIEFPRSTTAGPSHSEELAEPVFDRPRIMEAPGLVPAPPTLGGILIEPAELPASEKRPGFEMPLQSARMARRLAATLIDAVIILAGLALFAGICWRVTASIPSMRLAVPILVIAAAILWAAYQYLLIVHCGTTPGLKLAKLKLSHFDGTAVQRKMRRWRVLASVLSGLSLGLGYGWCFLDEDQLCWHDRITRTYMAPKA